MRLPLIVWLFGMAFLPDSCQLKSSGISLESLLQKSLNDAAGSLKTLTSSGSIAKQPPNSQPSIGPDPYIDIAEQDARRNTFGIEGIQLAYRNGKTMSKAQCIQNCSRDEACVVSMYCNESPVEENCANLLTCTITRREKGRLCHTYVKADKPRYLPHSLSASSCQYLSIHPNCRNKPHISNTDVDQHPIMEDGVARYRYSCSAGYEHSNKGSVFGVCDKQGGWTVPFLTCRKSQSKGAPSLLPSLVMKDTAVGEKQDVQDGAVNIQLASPNVVGFGNPEVAARPPTEAPKTSAPDTPKISALEQAVQHIKSLKNGGV